MHDRLSSLQSFSVLLNSPMQSVQDPVGGGAGSSAAETDVLRLAQVSKGTANT